jgi:hypothetical protein
MQRCRKIKLHVSAVKVKIQRFILTGQGTEEPLALQVFGTASATAAT